MARKNTQPTSTEIAEMQRCYDTEKISLREVATRFGWNRHTLGKYINVRRDKTSGAQLKQNRVKAVIDWRRRTKEKLVEYMGGKCVCCGYSKCVRSLHFHHKDPNEKDFTISGKSHSFERLKHEVDKCVLVCSNCHGEIHDGVRIIGI